MCVCIYLYILNRSFDLVATEVLYNLYTDNEKRIYLLTSNFA